MSPKVTGYYVLYGLAGGNYTSNIFVGTNTSVTVSGLAPGATYGFVVMACNAPCNGQSPYSNEIIVGIPPLPSISGQPRTQAVMQGSTATFSVSALSPVPLTYQWFDGTTALAGATNATLTLSNVNKAITGSYSVVITDSSGSVTSSVAKLQMTNAPTLAITPSGTNIVVSWTAMATGFTLQQNTSLATTNWVANSYPVSTNGATASITVPMSAGHLFFRMVSEPTGPPTNTLAITKWGTNVMVSWPSSLTGYTLQQNAKLTTTNWVACNYPVSTNGTLASITIPASGNLFFRLFEP